MDWLVRRRLPTKEHWSSVVPSLPLDLQLQFHREFNRCREDYLDSCQGECVLRQPALAKIVADTLLHFDGVRYRLGDFVVMPNHVHLLAAFPGELEMAKQCDSWLHFSARQINVRLKSKGKFWQQEPFDHLVRSPEQYEHFRRYIKDNGRKAQLKESEYLYRRLADS